MRTPLVWRLHALPKSSLVRSTDASRLLESFLVSGVVAVLGIRFYLELAGYPQLGGRGLHIAHMLWGGLLMTLALVLLLAFLGRRVQHLAALVAGVGFGTFIDELGKFITSDNNYFFQPTIALIYIIFVLLFLGFRILQQRPLSPEECLINGADLVKELLLSPGDSAKRDQALLLLRASGSRVPLVSALEAALQQLETVPPEPSALAVLLSRLRTAYHQVAAWRGFHRLVEAVFIVHAIFFVVLTLGIIIFDPQFTLVDPHLSVADAGQFFASVLSSLLVVRGVLALFRSRLTAYHWFRRAILVSIFLIQVFAFYAEQLLALVGLAVDLVLLVALDYMIHEEQRRVTAQLLATSPPRS
jgi:hypothetical protein